jgi:hypothetical protein
MLVTQSYFFVQSFSQGMSYNCFLSSAPFEAFKWLVLTFTLCWLIFPIFYNTTSTEAKQNYTVGFFMFTSNTELLKEAMQTLHHLWGLRVKKMHHWMPCIAERQDASTEAIRM